MFSVCANFSPSRWWLSFWAWSQAGPNGPAFRSWKTYHGPRRRRKVDLQPVPVLGARPQVRVALGDDDRAVAHDLLQALERSAALHPLAGEGVPGRLVPGQAGRQ